MGDVPARLPLEIPGQTTRRTFHVTAIYGLWSLIAAALGVPAMAYLLFPPKARRRPGWVDAGDVSTLQPESPVEMVFRRNEVDGWKVISEKSTAWVVKHQSGELVAYGPQCTHLGCAYHWDEGRKHFLCPCHNSVFAIDGQVVSGPAPRPLDRFDIRVQNGRLLVGALRESVEKS